MENTSPLNEYIMWVIIISLTIFFFNYFVKIYPNFKKLFPTVFVTVWICATIATACFEYLSSNTIYPFSFTGFAGIMFFRLPATFFIGGITFWIKYNKLKKNNSN